MTRSQLFWRNLWLTVRLAPADVRARKQMLRLLGALLYLPLYALLLIRNYRESGMEGVLLYVAIGLPALAITWGLRLRHKQDDQNVGLGLMSYSANPPEQDLAAHRSRLAGELLRMATLVDRATGEQAVVWDLLPVEQVAVVRQRTLQVARQPALWSRYTEQERQLLMDAEGSWPTGIAEHWVSYAEAVRVLRWALRLDDILVPFEFAALAIGPSLELVQRPDSVKGRACLPAWDLRPAQTAAEVMRFRTVAEACWRGLIKVDDETERTVLIDFAQQAHANPVDDLLLGTQTIAIITEDQLRSIALLAQRRLQALTHIIDYLNGPADGPFSLQSVPE